MGERNAGSVPTTAPWGLRVACVNGVRSGRPTSITPASCSSCSETGYRSAPEVPTATITQHDAPAAPLSATARLPAPLAVVSAAVVVVVAPSARARALSVSFSSDPIACCTPQFRSLRPGNIFQSMRIFDKSGDGMVSAAEIRPVKQ